MKKIISKLKEIFVYIGHFVDKKIIIPITKFFVFLRDNFGKDSKRFEKIINKKSSLLFLTLALALIFFIAVDSKSISMIETSAEVLYNQKVDVIYNEEAYVLEGVPDKVDITLIGRKSDLYLAKQITNNEVTVDLTGLKPGTHKVQIRYKRALASINYKLDPSVATITIRSKVSESRTVTVDLLNKDNLDPKLIITNTTITRSEVIIKDSEENLNRVATVKALIDINNIVNPTVGAVLLKDIPLIAYDENGDVINVEIVPAKVDANITITSPNKVVPLQIIPEGTLTFGKAISSIDSNVNNVTIYGEETALANIENIPVTIDVSGLKDDREYNVTLTKPSGVRSMSVGIANVTVVIGDEATKEFDNINIEYRNLDSRYTVLAKSQSDIAVTVVVRGVQSVLDSIDPSTIRSYVDLAGYGPGEHEVDVSIERSDIRVTYVPKVKKVTLTISKK